jgi:Ca2+-binding RTX toxin-like protein
MGTPGNDVITRTPGDDIILGLGGNDRIFGLGGGDLSCGGADGLLIDRPDILDGGDEEDRLDGSPGNDRLYGRARSDVLVTILTTARGYTLLRTLANETRISQPEVGGPPPEVSEPLSQPLDETGTSQTQSISDKSGSQFPTLAKEGIPPGYSSEIIQVKFREGTDVDPPEASLPPDLRNSVASITRLFSLSEQELDEIGAGRLKLWFQITLKPGTDAAAFIEDLKRLESVEIAEPAPLPAPPPSQP